MICQVSFYPKERVWIRVSCFSGQGAAAPLVPLTLTIFSLEEVITRLVKIVL